jgi:hypothetical protein
MFNKHMCEEMMTVVKQMNIICHLVTGALLWELFFAELPLLALPNILNTKTKPGAPKRLRR